MEENKKSTPDPEQDENVEEKVKIDEEKASDVQPTESVELTAKTKTKKPISKLVVLGVIAIFAIALAVIYGYRNGIFKHTHKFGEWSTMENATCVENGRMIRYCYYCRIGQVETIPADGHNFGDWYEVTSATCVAEGEDGRTCVKCGAYENRSIPAGGHISIIDEGINPTCSSEGLSEGSHCAVCEKILEVQVSLHKVEHKLSNIQMEDEYCGEAQVSSIYCGDCGEYVTSFGHHYIKSVTEATCTEDGEVRYTCDICGDSYFNVISAGGHIGGEYEIVSHTTCENEGIAEQKCMICDELIDTLSVDKKSHSYSISSYGNGVITYGCSECGDSYSVENESEVFPIVSFISDYQPVGAIFVAYGDKIECFPEIEKDGYHLAHWMVNDGSEAIYDNGCIYEDTELVAVWEEEKVLNTEYSDVAIYPSVETSFTFLVVAENENQIKNNLFIFDINDNKVEYSINAIGNGEFEISSDSYQPSEIYYAIAEGEVSFVGTESHEIQFSIAGENKVDIEISSSVKWLEYSNVYGIIDTNEGQLLLTDDNFNVGDNVAIYEDSKDNIVLVVKMLAKSEQLGYNAYAFEIADYEEVFDTLEVSVVGDLSDGVVSIDPSAADEIMAEFMASPLYANARRAAVEWGAKYDLELGRETYDVDLAVKNGRVIVYLKYTIELEDNWEICITCKNTFSSGFDYHLSYSDTSAIVKMTNQQTIQVSLSNKQKTGDLKYGDAKEAYLDKLEEYKRIFKEIKENPSDVNLTEYKKTAKNIRIGGVDIRLGYVTARFSLAAEFNFELSGTVGVNFEITTTQLMGVRDEKVVNSKFVELTGVNAFVHGELRVEFLARTELFIHVAGIGVYGNVGIGPYVELGGAGSMGYDGHKTYMGKFSVYLDAGIRAEINIGFKGELLGIVLFKLSHEVFGEDFSFPGMPLGSKEIWLSFVDYTEDFYISGNCSLNNQFSISEIINTDIKYQDLNDMTFGYKTPESITYSIISVSGYRTKINLSQGELYFDNVGEDVTVEVRIRVSDTISKTVTVHYSASHPDECVHFLCDNGFHRGGEATCTDKAICERCGLEYGDEPVGHIYNGRECTVCGQMKASEGLEYELLDDGTYAVVGIGNCQDDYIVIPVQHLEVYVTTVDQYAFQYCKNLTNISFEDGSMCTTIGKNAFDGCSSLKTVQIPVSITKIATFAFNSCTSLTSINFEENSQLQIIGEYAFRNCSSLNNVVIPGGVAIISDAAFLFCSSLDNIVLSEGVTIIGNSVFQGCIKITSIGSTRSDADLKIPDSVTTIGYDAFWQCTSLKSVILTKGSKLTTIGDNAFEDNINLEILVIPENVTTIGYNAFKGCTSLISIEIPASVTSIGNYAFSGCSSLENLTFAKDSQLTTIGVDAFADCISLLTVEIPKNVTIIEHSAFANCTSLSSVVFSGILTNTDTPLFIFQNCTSLQNVIFAGTMEQWNAFNYGRYGNLTIPATYVQCSDGRVPIIHN